LCDQCAKARVHGRILEDQPLSRTVLGTEALVIREDAFHIVVLEDHPEAALRLL
jgi:hypothetical protein